MNDVSLAQQKFREISPVLSGYSGNQGYLWSLWHGSCALRYRIKKSEIWARQLLLGIGLDKARPILELSLISHQTWRNYSYHSGMDSEAGYGKICLGKGDRSGNRLDGP